MYDLDNANGYFIGDTNRIVISRNAEGGMLLRTAGHESYHFIENNSAESAKILTDFVIDALARMGQKLDGSGKYVHPEIKALVDDYEALEEIRKQFMKGMESASASFAESKKKNPPKKRRISQAVLNSVKKKTIHQKCKILLRVIWMLLMKTF